MQFITSLFGGSGNSILTSVFALGVVLVLIFLALWALKLIFRASSGVGRGRNRRLSVVDTLALDPKRQLIIVRRDNIEHLILTGGPSDVVVESGIAVTDLPVTSARRPVPTVPARPGPRPVVKPDAAAPIPAPVPVRTGTPVIAPPAIPAAPPPLITPAAANSGTALGRLRELNKPIAGRRSASLRHTGLMRPVSQPEPAPGAAENPAGARPDSDKEVTSAPSGQTEFGDSSSSEPTDAYTADRN